MPHDLTEENVRGEIARGRLRRVDANHLSVLPVLPACTAEVHVGHFRTRPVHQRLLPHEDKVGGELAGQIRTEGERVREWARNSGNFQNSGGLTEGRQGERHISLSTPSTELKQIPLRPSLNETCVCSMSS